MAEVKWIKITTDMFDNRKIRYMRKLPDGNNMVLIWVMLLTMAGRCNSGGLIFLTENIPYTPKMLADELGFEENTVKLALSALERLEMLTTDDGNFKVAGWDEYQNTSRMVELREYNRLAQQKTRERKKELSNDTIRVDEFDNVNDNVNDRKLTSQECQDTDIDIEIEIDNKRTIVPNQTTKEQLSLLNSDGTNDLALPGCASDPIQPMIQPSCDPVCDPVYDPEDSKALYCIVGKSVSERFDEFWSIYPRRMAKQQAVSAWKKIKTQETVDRILADIQRRMDGKEWRKDNQTYIPYPATYLNGERWKDEAADCEAKDSGASLNAPIVQKLQTFKTETELLSYVRNARTKNELQALSDDDVKCLMSRSETMRMYKDAMKRAK